MDHSKPYIFRWRRHLVWHRVTVITHRYDAHQDKLVAFRHPDGGLYEIKNWSECEARLGRDWVEALAAQRAAMPTPQPQRVPLQPPSIMPALQSGATAT